MVLSHTCSLPPAFFINRMKELYKIMQKAQGKVDMHCESCSRASPAKSFCRDCAHFICSQCEDAHNTMRTFSEHVVVSLEDLRQNTAVHATTKKATLKCEEHTTEEVRLYCYDCEQLICRDCIIIDHAGHKYDFINKAAAKCKGTLSESVDPVQRINRDINLAVEELKGVEEQVSKRCTVVSKAIDTSAESLILAIRKHQKELQSEAKRLTEKQLSNLAVQRKNAQMAAAEVESLIEFMSRSCQGEDDQGILAMKKQLLDRSAELSQKYEHAQQQFRPSNNVELEFSCGYNIAGVLTAEMQLKEVPG